MENVLDKKLRAKKVNKANEERRIALVKFAKTFHAETFSNAKSYNELLGLIVAYKRMARAALRGE